MWPPRQPWTSSERSYFEFRSHPIDKAKKTIPIAVEDVKREVKILQALTGHENVVRFYNAFEDKNSVYIVMELCEGGELLDRILARKDAWMRRMDEILALPYLENDFKSQEVPVSDNDLWLYDDEDKLNSVIQGRQKEMEFYNLKKETKKKAKGKQEAGSSSEANVNVYYFIFGDISKIMQQFMHKVSSYKGAEVPENREFKEVNLDGDRFMKNIESMIGTQGRDKQADDASEGSEESSDMDFDDFEDEYKGERYPKTHLEDKVFSKRDGIDRITVSLAFVNKKGRFKRSIAGNQKMQRKWFIT